VVGGIRFDADGEWSKGRVLTVQFQGIKNNDIDQFRRAGTQVVLDPIEYRSGTVIWPYGRGRQ
jgi:branched-chain amino acid transport system substrate-binding protein